MARRLPPLSSSLIFPSQLLARRWGSAEEKGKKKRRFLYPSLFFRSSSKSKKLVLPPTFVIDFFYPCVDTHEHAGRNCLFTCSGERRWNARERAGREREKERERTRERSLRERVESSEIIVDSSRRLEEKLDSVGPYLGQLLPLSSPFLNKDISAGVVASAGLL